jgi:hypothetical protein
LNTLKSLNNAGSSIVSDSKINKCLLCNKSLTPSTILLPYSKRSLQTAIADACCRKELPLLQFLLDNFDQDYFDFNSALKCMSCSRTNDDTSVNMLQLLMEKFGETMISIDIHVVMEVAITRCDKSLVKYLLSKFQTCHVHNVLFIYAICLIYFQ